MYVCVYVSNTITYKSLDVKSWFLAIRYILSENGLGSYMKVIGSSSRSREQKKARKSLFTQCKTSTGNNSGSIESVKYACSMGFSATADRMLWPPSLSRDRKWPRLTKYRHSRAICHRLEGNLVVQIELWRSVNRLISMYCHLNILDAPVIRPARSVLRLPQSATLIIT